MTGGYIDIDDHFVNICIAPTSSSTHTEHYYNYGTVQTATLQQYFFLYHILLGRLPMPHSDVALQCNAAGHGGSHAGGGLDSC